MAVLPDFDDPCDVYAKLREAHHKLLTGQQQQAVRYTSGNGQTREVEFTRANITELTVAMQRARAACEALTNPKPKRFGVVTGGKLVR